MSEKSIITSRHKDFAQRVESIKNRYKLSMDSAEAKVFKRIVGRETTNKIAPKLKNTKYCTSCHTQGYKKRQGKKTKEYLSVKQHYNRNRWIDKIKWQFETRPNVIKNIQKTRL